MINNINTTHRHPIYLALSDTYIGDTQIDRKKRRRLEKPTPQDNKREKKQEDQREGKVMVVRISVEQGETNLKIQRQEHKTPLLYL